MKSILVIGMGRFGRHCARELMSLGHEVMAIDINERNIDSIAGDVSCAQIGDATDPLFMSSIGVSDFDECFICIGDNLQASLESTCLCKELGCKFIVARAAKDIHRKFLLKMGADEVVYPEKQTAIWTAVTYSADNVFDYIPLDSQHAIFEVGIPDSWDNKTIMDIDVRKRYNINILAIKNNGQLILSVHPGLLLKAGMTMLVLGTKKDIQKCFKINS